MEQIKEKREVELAEARAKESAQHREIERLKRELAIANDQLNVLDRQLVERKAGEREIEAKWQKRCQVELEEIEKKHAMEMSAMNERIRSVVDKKERIIRELNEAIKQREEQLKELQNSIGLEKSLG